MKNRRARCQLAFLLLLFLLVILAALSVSVGSVSLSFQDIQAILLMPPKVELEIASPSASPLFPFCDIG